MTFNVTVPWKIHQTGAGSGSPQKRNWWTRKKHRNNTGAHPILMKEQDLDHLGALHDTVLHAKRRKMTDFLAQLFGGTD